MVDCGANAVLVNSLGVGTRTLCLNFYRLFYYSIPITSPYIILLSWTIILAIIHLTTKIHLHKYKKLAESLKLHCQTGSLVPNWRRVSIRVAFVQNWKAEVLEAYRGDLDTFADLTLAHSNFHHDPESSS